MLQSKTWDAEIPAWNLMSFLNLFPMTRTLQSFKIWNLFDIYFSSIVIKYAEGLKVFNCEFVATKIFWEFNRIQTFTFYSNVHFKRLKNWNDKDNVEFNLYTFAQKDRNRSSDCCLLFRSVWTFKSQRESRWEYFPY